MDAPLRLRNEVQLGFKQVKWIAGIELVADISDIGGGQVGTTPTTSSSAIASRSERHELGHRECHTWIGIGDALR